MFDITYRLIHFFFRKRTLLIGALLGVMAIASVWVCNWWVGSSTADRLYTSVENIPANDVALVLGASYQNGFGHINYYFKYRMDAAAELYREGKVKHLLVSGDNHRKGYDEPTDMRDYLMKLGVPESAITLDSAPWTRWYEPRKFLVNRN